MQQVIWKYPISGPGGWPLIMQLPKGAKILTVQSQREMPVLWALVDPHAPLVGRIIWVIATGQFFDIRATRFDWIGTCQFNGGDLIYHFFDSGEEGK